MRRRTLPQRTHITADAVRTRAARFPLVAELLGERIDALAESPVHFEKAPHLLPMLEATGANTEALLRVIEDTVRHFDALCPRGWKGVRLQLARAKERGHFLSLCAELVVTRWMGLQGLSVVEFEPTTSDGHRSDLLIEYAAHRLPIEVVAPGLPDDAIDHPNSRLVDGLARVESGLTVDVAGYGAYANSLDPDHDPDRAVTKADVEHVVREFRHQAAVVDSSKLPATVVEARPGQPISIVATGYDPGQPGTAVISHWGESGLTPNADRLVEIIRSERKQLPQDDGGAILIDLSRWPDFIGGYYLEQVKIKLCRHRLPSFVGTFTWSPARPELEWRQRLHADDDWTLTELGFMFTKLWAGCQLGCRT